MYTGNVERAGDCEMRVSSVYRQCGEGWGLS